MTAWKYRIVPLAALMLAALAAPDGIPHGLEAPGDHARRHRATETTRMEPQDLGASVSFLRSVPPVSGFHYGLLAAGPSLDARAPSVDDLVTRVAGYAMRYGSQLGAVVAEEEYTQWIERVPGTATVPGLGATRRAGRVGARGRL